MELEFLIDTGATYHCISSKNLSVIKIKHTAKPVCICTAGGELSSPGHYCTLVDNNLIKYALVHEQFAENLLSCKELVRIGFEVNFNKSKSFISKKGKVIYLDRTDSGLWKVELQFNIEQINKLTTKEK